MSGPGAFAPYRWMPGVIETNPNTCSIRISDNAVSASIDLSKQHVHGYIKTIDHLNLLKVIATYNYYFNLKHLFQQNPATIINNYSYCDSQCYNFDINKKYSNFSIYSALNITTNLYDKKLNDSILTLANGNYNIVFDIKHGIDRLSVQDNKSTVTLNCLIYDYEDNKIGIKSGYYNNTLYLWRPTEKIKETMIVVNGITPKINLDRFMHRYHAMVGHGCADLTRDTFETLDPSTIGIRRDLIPPQLVWQNKAPLSGQQAKLADYLMSDNTNHDTDYYILEADGLGGDTRFYDPHQNVYRQGKLFKRLEDIVVAKNQKATLYAFTDHPICTIVDLKTEKLFR